MKRGKQLRFIQLIFFGAIIHNLSIKKKGLKTNNVLKKTAELFGGKKHFSVNRNTKYMGEREEIHGRYL